MTSSSYNVWLQTDVMVNRALRDTYIPLLRDPDDESLG
jgi:hypothetical protein